MAPRHGVVQRAGGRESGMEDEHKRREQRAKRKRKADCNERDEEVVEGYELDSEAAGEVPQLAGGRAVGYMEWRERVVEDVKKDEAERRAKRQRRGGAGGEGNDDDECEYGDDDETIEARIRRAPMQSKLNFSAASTSNSSGRKAVGQSQRGGYTDVVVL